MPAPAMPSEYTELLPPIPIIDGGRGSQPPQETVIVWDWDDTLLSSSFIAHQGLNLSSPALPDLTLPEDPNATPDQKKLRETAEQLKELEKCVYQVLKLSIDNANRSIIVTNAEHGWVQMSCAKFFPSVVPLLASLTVISARSTFEHLFPNCPLKWKYYSVHGALVGGGFFGVDGRSLVDKHVVSLGDSHVEREAVRALCRGVPATRTKTVKFAERPTCEQLRRQLELVAQCFAYITSHQGDLDLQLTVTVSPDSPAVPPPTVEKLHPELPATESANRLLSDSETKDITPRLIASKQLAHESRGMTNQMVVA